MKTIAEDESYPRVQASSETSRSCVKRTKQREEISSERLATTQRMFFFQSNVFDISQIRLANPF